MLQKANDLLRHQVELLESIKGQQEERIKNFEFKLENVQKALSTNILENTKKEENSSNYRVSYIG